MNELKVIELFSGIGAQRKALKRLGILHEVVGVSEIDKYAHRSYEAIHGKTHNFGDITKIEKLPYCDLLTYSFPCQDLSVAGKQRGMSKGSGTRSGLLWEVERLLEGMENRPKYLLLENVKNLVGEQNRPDFALWLKRLRELGYNNYWNVLNAKDYGIPQNRERVFCVSILQDIDPFMGLDGLYPWPKSFDNGIRLKDMLEDEVDEKYYIDEEKTRTLLRQIQESGKANTNPSGHGMNGNVNIGDFAPTITTNKGEGVKILMTLNSSQDGKVHDISGISQCLSAGHNNSPKIAIRSHESTTRRGRVGRGVVQTLQANGTEQAFVEILKNETECLNSKDENGKQPSVNDRVYSTNGVSTTITTAQFFIGNILEKNEAAQKLIERFRIRKLTPLECWRLMGFDDEDFRAAEKVNSNSQLYKQAGNSIVVDVLEAIFRELFNWRNDEKTC